MKKLIILSVAMLLAWAPTARAIGADTLRAEAFIAINADSAVAPSALALRFAIDSMPAADVIDLALLELSVSLDSTFDASQFVLVQAATSAWQASDAPTVESPASADSLQGFSTISLNKEGKIVVDVTEIVQRWHAGTVANEGFVIRVSRNESKEFSLINNNPSVDAVLIIYHAK